MLPYQVLQLFISNKKKILFLRCGIYRNVKFGDYVFSLKAEMKQHCIIMHKSVKASCKPIANAQVAVKTEQTHTHTQKVGCPSDAKVTVHSES